MSDELKLFDRHTQFSYVLFVCIMYVEMRLCDTVTHSVTILGAKRLHFGDSVWYSIYYIEIVTCRKIFKKSNIIYVYVCVQVFFPVPDYFFLGRFDVACCSHIHIRIQAQRTHGVTEIY